MENPSSPRKEPILSPLGKSTLTGWKNGFEFQQKGSTKKGAAPSRYNKRTNFDPKKRGTFQKRVRMEDAPHLMTVVNAKSEIKEKANKEVAERAKKKEERRKMKSRVIVEKPPPKQARSTWTSVLSKDPDTRVSPSLRKSQATKPSGFKPPPGSIKAPDWRTAYQDILSPSSGKPKMVAKQDLVHESENKLLSPKKKTRTPTKKVPLPSLSLDDEDLPERPVAAAAAAAAAAKPVKPALVIDDESSDEDSQQGNADANANMARAVTPPLEEQEAKGAVRSAVVQDDLDDFVDVGSESSSDVEAESAGYLEPLTPAEKAPKEPKVKPQLILEFALPSEDGEDDDEEGLQVPVDIQSFDDLSSVGSWPSIESQDSYDTKMNKMMQRWMDIHGGYDDDNRTLYDNDVDLEDNVLDHIVLAVPDLDEAMDQFESMAGIRPTPVGPLQGLGAKTAHIGLDENRYLELLAPDFDNPGPLGEELARLPKGTMTPYHYSIRSSEVSRLIEGYVYDVLGWDPDHIAMVQALPDNSIRQWDMLTMYGHDVGGVAPCYVKWKDPAQHPTATIALKATLTTCTVRAPQGHDVHKLITDVGGIDVAYGEPLLEVTVTTPKGPLTFSAKHPKGLVFPGYDVDHRITEVPDLMAASGDRTVDEDYFAIGGSDSESSLNEK